MYIVQKPSGYINTNNTRNMQSNYSFTFSLFQFYTYGIYVVVFLMQIKV